MRFEILDVEHGFCAYAIGSDGACCSSTVVTDR